VTSAEYLTFRTDRRGRVYVLSVSGDLGAGSAAGFTEAVERAVADGASRVVIDLSGVRSLDAVGVRALAAAAGSAVPGRRVILRSLRPALRQVVAAVSPDLDLAGSGLVMARADAVADIDPGSRTWMLERESRMARSRAQQTVADTRRMAEMLAVTEDEIAVTFLRLAHRRPGGYERMMALSRRAHRQAEQLRGLTGAAAAPRASLLSAISGHNVGADTGTLRRAIAFIDKHAGDDISAADIADAACVTSRAVQLAFRRYLGITPLGYLRQVRLERAHRELLAARPAPGTVTRIAADWQFTNLSRFTARYRATYGVLPSQTLRQISFTVRQPDECFAQ
jgi:anti-anti-sigma factor